MTSMADLFRTTPNDPRVFEAALALEEEPRILAVAAEVPRLMLAARMAQQIAPGQYEQIEGLFQERAKTQAVMVDASPYSNLFPAIAPHLAEFSFFENREILDQSPEVRPWLDALNVSQERRSELWRFIDARLPDVVSDLVKAQQTNLGRYFEGDVAYASTPGPDWQHLSPWNFATFIGDVFISASIITAGVCSVMLAGAPPVGFVLVVGAGVLYLAGTCIKNGFETQRAA